MSRILLLADNHYGQHCAQHLHSAFAEHQCDLVEDDWQPLADSGLGSKYDLLALHMIAGTCNNPLPDEQHEAPVRSWIESGKPILLLHGSSAAFWHWSWWPALVGWRWVRPNDPYGSAASTHPIRPYRLERAKTTHPLAAQLRDIDLPSDEIYIHLEQTCPSWTLLQTTTEEGTFPMASCHHTPHGGAIASFLPGHDPSVTQHPDIHYNIARISQWLLQESA